MLIQVSLNFLHDLTLPERGSQGPAAHQDVVTAAVLDAPLIENHHLSRITDATEMRGHRWNRDLG